MGSKRFRNKTCVYCGLAPSTVGEHVLARAFFIERSRGELPKVPACVSCNTSKSTLEQYLATVLPFGGRHADAHELLTTLVPDRLAGNLALAREINATLQANWHPIGIGEWDINGGSVRIDPSK